MVSLGAAAGKGGPVSSLGPGRGFVGQQSVPVLGWASQGCPYPQEAQGLALVPLQVW